MIALKVYRICIQKTLFRSLSHISPTLLNNEITKIEPSDDLLQNIKSATDTSDLFDILSGRETTMKSPHVMETLKSLFNLQKSGNSTLQSSQILTHPQFQQICQRLKYTSRSLDVNGIIEALKVLCYIGVPTNSEIAYILLNLLRIQINDLRIGHVIFLDFLLKKFDHSPLIEALQIALPMILQIQLSTQIDHENVPQLTELLAFVSHNKVSDQCFTSIITALTLHGHNLKVEEAKGIIWSLCDIHQFKSNYEKLLENAFHVFCKFYKKIPFEAVETTLTKVSDKIVQKNMAFYNEEFMNKCASYVFEQDVGFVKANYILRKLKKINFVNIFLLDYLCEKVIQTPDCLINAKPTAFYTFVSGLSTANYQPKNWESLKTIILRNPIIHSNKNELPWMKLNVELMSLGCYDKSLLAKVFDDDFLDKHLAREQNTLDYIQMLSLYQSVMILCSDDYDGKLPSQRFINKAIEINLDKNTSNSLLKTSLEGIFGGESYVSNRLTTKFGHFIDHAIIFDKDQTPVSTTKKDDRMHEVPKIEDLVHGENKVVAVLNFPRSHYALNLPRLKGIFALRTMMLEAIGIPTLAVNYNKWTEMPEHERLQYLEREIRSKLGQHN